MAATKTEPGSSSTTCNVYVRSERAGQRVMASLSGFFQWRLRLRINASKSAVARSDR